MTNEEKKTIIELGKRLVKECKHEVVRQFGANPKYKYEGSAQCEICGKFLGWWCPSEKSPNHTCQYYGVHDNKEDPSLGSEFKYWDEDDCIYCHQPEERK